MKLTTQRSSNKLVSLFSRERPRLRLSHVAKHLLHRAELLERPEKAGKGGCHVQSKLRWKQKDRDVGVLKQQCYNSGERKTAVYFEARLGWTGLAILLFLKQQT